MREIVPAPGVICISKAGRDAGRCFVILKAADDAHVLIADGELRKVNKPKRKKLKHLWIRPAIAEPVARLAETGGELKDSDVRKALKAFEQADHQEEG